MPPGPKGHHLVTCKECSRQFVTRWKRKIYCDPCGVEHRIERPLSQPRTLKQIAENRPEIAAALQQRSVDATVQNIADAFWRPPVDYVWASYFSTPYSAASSKNRRWTNNGHGGVFLSAEVRSYQDELIRRISGIDRTWIKMNKVWISLFVQKPNHKSDAINVVDTICDAVKKAIDLDDRWFCIDRLDWEIAKKDPKIFIKIGQEAVPDQIVCSHCGRLQSPEFFTKSKNGPLGRSRSCMDCSRTVDKARRDTRRAALAK